MRRYLKKGNRLENGTSPRLNKGFIRFIGREMILIVSPHPSFAISASGNISADAGAPDTFPVKGRLGVGALSPTELLNAE